MRFDEADLVSSSFPSQDDSNSDSDSGSSTDDDSATEVEDEDTAPPAKVRLSCFLSPVQLSMISTLTSTFILLLFAASSSCLDPPSPHGSSNLCRSLDRSLSLAYLASSSPFFRLRLRVRSLLSLVASW